MKKEIVLFLMMSSVSVMNVAMDSKDKSDRKDTNQVACCPRSFAVPPCERCAQICAMSCLEKKPAQVPLPLSSSRERERTHPPR